LRAFCLGVTGFTNPQIGEALASDHGKQLIVTLGIADLERGTAIVSEIELGKVAVQMGSAAMLVDADHSALEHGEHVLNRVGVDHGAAIVAGIFLGGMLHGGVLGILLA